MTSLPSITLATASALALVVLLLAGRVSASRFKHRISIGDQGNEELLVRMRTLSNFVEYVPLILILMALLEAVGGDRTILAWTGVLLVVSRILHAIGMPRPAPNVFRGAGAMITWGLMAALAAWGVWLSVGG